MNLPMSRVREPMTVDPSLVALADLRGRIEERLEALLAEPSHAPLNLANALRHALLAPSKRMRPVMLALIAGSDPKRRAAAIDAGCAVEMVHTASLILDDLPCMDDATLRRQRPATHVAFGESTAVLASISLLTRAFAVLAELPGVDASTQARLATILSSAVGTNGLAAGQEIDLNSRADLESVDRIEELNWLKTGVLFVAAAEMGAVLRGLAQDEVDAVRRFAKHFGIAFQTSDDLLDVTATPDLVGKDVHKDDGKPTLITLLGPDVARYTAREHLQHADRALTASGIEADPIRSLGAMFFGEWPNAQ